jgi:hypothetical protein
MKVTTMSTPLRVDIERRRRPCPLHRAWGLEDQCLTGLCRKLVSAGYPDSPAYTWDGTGYGMRIKSVHRYARLTIREETGNGIPRHVSFVPYAGPRIVQDGLREAAE